MLYGSDPAEGSDRLYGLYACMLGRAVAWSLDGSDVSGDMDRLGGLHVCQLAVISLPKAFDLYGDLGSLDDFRVCRPRSAAAAFLQDSSLGEDIRSRVPLMSAG